MAPAYISLPAKLKSKLTNYYMKACKTIHGGCTLSNKKLLKKCGWLDLENTVKASALKFFHKIIYNQKPHDLVDIFNIPSRSVSVITCKLNPKLKALKEFHLIKTMNAFNNLKSDIRNQRPYLF